MRLSTLFALVAVLVLALAGDALAFGRRCNAPPAGCSICPTAQPRGGLLAGFRDRVQARHDARAGGGCQQAPAVAFPGPAPQAYAAVTYSGGGCPGGVCPVR